MHPFTRFSEVYGPGHDCRDPDNSEGYRGNLPDSLLEFWTEEKLCGYRDGMFWFVDPAEYVEVLDEWKVTGYTVFGRNGFADLFLHSGEGASLLNVHLGTVNHMRANFDAFINQSLTRESFMDDLLFRKIHTKAVAKLGRPAADECYAFVPALALGGPGTVETVQRVKLREHLSILAQMHNR
jgi:hypothetical protein